MAKKIKNYVKDKQPKTLWNKIGPFVKLREYLASNITPDVYANERGLKTKIMEFFGQDVPKANVDDFSQNLWFRFLNQPNNLKEENGIVRIPDNIKSIISDRINGGWEKMAKKYGRELDSLDNKIIDGRVAGKDVSDLEELRDVTSRKLGMVEEGIDLLKKARTGEHQVFNEYNFIPDAYGDLNDLSGLSSFTMYRDDRGRMVVKDKYDFYRDDQPFGVGVVTKILDTIGYPFEIRDYVEDKIPYEESDPNKIMLRSIIDSKNDLDKRMEIRSKKQGGDSSKPEIDWDLFKSKYENMKRVGKGKHRTMDVEGMNMIYDALYDKGFNQRQIEAVLGNIIEESGGNPYAVSEDGKFRGLFQEYYKRYPPKEFERDKERFKSDKRGYINYMIDRFYDHVQDAGMYSIKDTKYDKAIHAVNEFMSEDPDTDYSYPLVYAFEAPSDKEGTYKNRKSVSNLISQSYVTDNVNNSDDADKKNNSIIDAILDIKNDLELQDPISTTRGEAFKEEVYGDNFEKVNEASGLGALKNFSVRWDPDAGMLDVKDDYDFSRKNIAEDIIPERDVPLRIRERIKYDPKKGSVLRNNDKALPKRFVRKYGEGGEAKYWWSNPDKRDEVVKRQDDNGEWQEKRRRLLEQAHSDLEKGEIDEDEFRRIAGFSNSEIGNLIISKDGNGEEIGAIINNLLDSIDIDKVKEGIDDAKEERENKSREDAYPYKLMAESLLTLADVASSTPGMLRLYNKMGLRLMPILKTIAESSKIQTIAGLSNVGVDGSQIALDPEGDNTFNYAGILGGAAEAIGGTNVIRNMSFMGRYGNRVDDVLDIANPIISTLGVVDDVSKMKEGGVVGKQREAYDYFTNKRGMSKIQALAIMGNLMAESGLKDDIYGDNRTSYGIQQWHNERMDKLFKHAKKKGHSTPTFKDQLEFLADEYEGKTGYSNFLYTRKGKEGPGYYNYSRQDFMNADNLKDAVIAWNQGAGRPHKSVIRNDDRYNYAMEVAKNLGLEIEENSVSLYGQMGFGDDGEIAASVTLPEVEVAAALPNPEAPSQEGQSEEERFRTWTETYGKDIINHLLTLDGKKDGDDSDYNMMYRQNQKESEEDKKMALINAVLPNIQLRIKGVTDN